MNKFYIRPCPFCGGKANIKANYSSGYYYVRVQCVVCDAQGRSYRAEKYSIKDAELAVTAWNLRAYDRINPEDIDALAYVREFRKQNEKVNHSPDEFIPSENISPDDMGK